MELTKEQILQYEQMSLDVMMRSKQERRDDAKISPLVGAVLVKPDGSVETAYRGELREGDHAEYTLLERKCWSEKVEGNILFATLEPCAPGARHFPKLGCAERIVNARIGKVYIGIEDPDPTVCRKGIKYLLDNGIEVEMYPRDLQVEIEECNKEFLSAAYERARLAEEEQPEVHIAWPLCSILDRILLHGIHAPVSRKHLCGIPLAGRANHAYPGQLP